MKRIQIPGIIVMMLAWPAMWLLLVAYLFHQDYPYWCEHILRLNVIPNWYPLRSSLIKVLIFLLSPPFLAVIVMFFRRGTRHPYIAPLVALSYSVMIGLFVSSQLAVIYKLPKCQDNIQKLTELCALYARQHGGRFPNSRTWVDDISPYITDPGVFRCPTDRSIGRCSYAMNDAWSDSLDPAWKKVVVGGKEIYNSFGDNIILLYETNKAGQNPHGSMKDIPIPGRHFEDRVGKFNFISYPNFNVLIQKTATP